MSADGGDLLQSSWTADRVAALVEHYNTGLSAAESAALIGGVSKNAVVSKRRRLGLLATASVGARSAADRGLPRLTGLGRIHRFRCPPALPTSPLPKMDDPPPAGARPSRLVERGFGMCAWPLGPAHEPGDYQTLFCGAPTVGCGRYCESHAARAYRRCEP